MRAAAGALLLIAAAALLVPLVGCGGSEAATSDAAASTAATASASAADPGGGSTGGSPAPTVVQQAPVRRVRVGDLDIGYRTIGPFGAAADSTPLLMIMGSSGTMDMWAPGFVDALAQGREVIVFDNRGMGETSDPGGAYRFSRLADDAARLVRALGFDQLDVLGWSMGGDVAIDLTVRHPELVRRLVSYAGSAGGSGAVPMSKKTLAVMTDTSGTAEERGLRLLTLLFPKAYRDAHPRYYERFPRSTEQVPAEAVEAQNRAIGEWKGVWGGLKRVSCPALFITGADDVITPPENAKLLAAAVPGADLEVVPGAGHGLMYQDPQKLADVVMDFLDR